MIILDKLKKTYAKYLKAIGAFKCTGSCQLCLVVVVFTLMLPVALQLAGIFWYFGLRLNLLSPDVWTWVDGVTDYQNGYIQNQYKPLVVSGALSFMLVYGLTLVAYGVGIKAYLSRELHGSARWANLADVKKSGLLNGIGIVLGQFGKKFLRFSTQQFVLVAAPTRSGKGVSFVIPNLLSWTESVVGLDIKQELYDITAGYRRDVLGQEVYLFNPFAEDKINGVEAPKTHRYNPLSSISKGVFRVGDTLAIGSAIWPSGGKDSFWNDSARNLFLAIVLLLLDIKDQRELEGPGSKLPNYPVTMGEVLRQAAGRGSRLSVRDYMAGLLEEYTWLSSECVDSIGNFLSAPPETLGNILSTFNAPLTIWRNPIVDAATSENDFDLRDVRKRRMTIYIGITPDHLAEAKLLLNLIFSQLINLNTKTLPEKDKSLKYTCLLLMDEFTSIGKVDIIAKAIGYIAGYNLRLLIIIQSPSQLESVYGKEDSRTMITNFAVRLVYPPKEQKDANEYSEMLGTYTELSANISRSRSIFNQRAGGSESLSHQKRPLMLPQELKEMNQDEQIVLMEYTKPIRCTKIRYYEDPLFTEKLLPPPSITPLDIQSFVARSQNKVRELSADEIDFNSQTLRDPPLAVDQLALLADAPSFDISDNSDFSEADANEFADACFSSLGVDISALEEGLADDNHANYARNVDHEDATLLLDEKIEVDLQAGEGIDATGIKTSAQFLDMIDSGQNAVLVSINKTPSTHELNNLFDNL
ncbi:type IV secretory system conjugative DNA transfer family protein [Polynucleobacter sp. AM-25C3]|uniref:type IV secretory system conjugative DNA transfer family protein n=1 Tax=Polynucleobacter sp. AM-25C3 TaxID=1855569 RepID=UPI00351CC211